MFAVNVPMLVGFRVPLGLSVGTASFVAPMYIVEVAPPRLRGGLVSFNQLAVTTGILIAYLVDRAFTGVPGDWRWVRGVAVIPGAALATVMLTVSHTPRWLVQRGRHDEARDVLTRLRDGNPDADAELADIEQASERERGTGLRDLLSPRIRPLLVVGVGLAAFQQLVGVTNVVFTVVAVLLLDRVGRRSLLITGTVGMIAALATLGIYFTSTALQDHASYLALVALLVFIASFAIGLGPVFWLMISEIFPVGVRSASMSVSTVVNWAANFLVAATFLTLAGAITRQGTFYLYVGIAVVALIFFLIKVPETKGRSLEQIQHDLAGVRT